MRFHVVVDCIIWSHDPTHFILLIVEAEFAYVMGMLEYIIQRISSTDVTAAASAWRTKCTDDNNSVSAGCFLNLHCGHNNQYSPRERDDLIYLINTACGQHV